MLVPQGFQAFLIVKRQCSAAFCRFTSESSPRQSPGSHRGAESLGFAHPLQLETMMPKSKEPPEWGDMPKKPGLYLSLNHGRDFPQQVMTGRGFSGPKIGPLHYMKTFYGQAVTLGFETLREARQFFPMTTSIAPVLQIVEGTLVHADKCYGDWDVCYIAAEFCRHS